MNSQELDYMLERLMKQDFSAGTEMFRDGLLKRCLMVLDEADEGTVLDDADLEMLAAAGDSYSVFLHDSSNGDV